METGTALFGMNLINGLQLCFQESSVQPAASKNCSIMTTTPLLLQYSSPPVPTTVFGCAKGFVHKVKVSETVQPVCQKLRQLPMSVRSAVSAEIQHLLQAGVIEKVDASPWVSPTVVL